MLRTAVIALFPLLLVSQVPQTGSGNSTENKIIGRVGDVTYRESDFLDYLPVVVQAEHLPQIMSSPELLAQMQQRFMESMLLVQQAKVEGIDKTPDFLTKHNGVTYTLMIQELVNAKTPELMRLSTPTEEQLRAFYDENRQSFKSPDTATARHILVRVRTDENDTDALSAEDALVKIARAREELANGKSWDEVAKDYSDDPGSNANGGLYENFNPAQMVQPFADAVRSQEIGKIGIPVKTQFGYHLIQVESRRLDTLQTFDEARTSVQNQLTEKMRNDVWTNWINSLKASLGFAEGDASTTAASSN
jgi:parvulin-like peptidyl-prolyl isomerase